MRSHRNATRIKRAVRTMEIRQNQRTANKPRHDALIFSIKLEGHQQ
jgi:hypothetical protein